MTTSNDKPYLLGVGQLKDSWTGHVKCCEDQSMHGAEHSRQHAWIMLTWVLGGEGEVQGGGLRIAQVRFVKKQQFFVNILFLFQSLLFNCNALFVNLTEQIVNIISPSSLNKFTFITKNAIVLLYVQYIV